MPWRDWQHDIERQYNPRAWASDVEAPAWVAQTTEYAALCRQPGCRTEVISLPHEDHFSTIPAQADPQHPVNQAMRRDRKAIVTGKN
jgi:hypothetical protein